MYEPNEKLITTRDLGAKDSPSFMKKGTKVTFNKVANPDCSDLSQSILIVERDGKLIGVKETDVRIKSIWRRMRAVKEVNEVMYKDYPRLRRSHHNYLKRLFYLTYYLIADIIMRKKVDGIDKVDWN